MSDLERTCDYLIVLVDSQVRVAGDVDELLAAHHRLTGPRRAADALAVLALVLTGVCFRWTRRRVS